MASIQLPQLPMPCHQPARSDGFNLRFEGAEERVCEQPRLISSPMNMQFLATQSHSAVKHSSGGDMGREMSGRKGEGPGEEDEEGKGGGKRGR